MSLKYFQVGDVITFNHKGKTYNIGKFSYYYPQILAIVKEEQDPSLLDKYLNIKSDEVFYLLATDGELSIVSNLKDNEHLLHSVYPSREAVIEYYPELLL